MILQILAENGQGLLSKAGESKARHRFRVRRTTFFTQREVGLRNEHRDNGISLDGAPWKKWTVLCEFEEMPVARNRGGTVVQR